MILGPVKFFLFFLVVVFFIIHHTVANLLIWNEKKRLKYFLRSISLTARLGLKILNVKVSRQGVRGEVRSRLIVANHLSYLDVLILVSHYPSLFITSTEIRDTFLLGRITKLAGCFFVERRKEKRTPETKDIELREMKEKFDAHFNVFLFPEGTSSDGKEVLPFKSTFFQLAVDAGKPVVPICLKYKGESASHVPWYGKMTFPDHLLKLCFQKEIFAEISEQEEIAARDRFEFARIAQKYISEAYAKD